MFQISSIKSWAEDDRPREKYILKGRNALSDAEIIAIIIGSGTKSISAVELAQQLLASTNNNLTDIFRLTLHDLVKFNGIGEAKAISLLAAFELSRRREKQMSGVKIQLTSSSDVYRYMRHHFESLQHEEFHIVFLNRANDVIGSKQISVGGFSGTVADGKVIFKTALEKGAQAIILAHNHPSGQLKPSDADKSLTKRLVEFGKYIDLPILDHLIFTDNGYFSFSDHGVIL
jgi:DNA repair protein RadC